VKKN
ncbi:Phosphoglucosamine mutase, partial [Haemophilus influenzae]